MKKAALVGLVLLGAVSLGAIAYRTPAQPSVGEKDTPPNATFGGVSLSIESATTTKARERGLSGRARLGEREAMLFVFKEDGEYGFWMKNTLIPLDIFWLDAQGQVVSIATEVATSSYPRVFYPARPARYVLETNAGFARAHSVATGTLLRLQNFPTVFE